MGPQRLIEFARSAIPVKSSLGGGKEPPPDRLQVDERFIQETAAAVLGGSLTIDEARAHVREYHRGLALAKGREHHRELAGNLLKIQEHRRRAEKEQAETDERLKGVKRYVKELFQPEEVSKLPWTMPMYSKLLSLNLMLLIALAGGSVMIANTLLSQPAWSGSVVKAFCVSISVVALPALVLALAHQTLQERNTDSARRFRRFLLVGMIVAFWLGLGSYALLYTDRGQPTQEVDITVLVDGGGSASSSESSQLERAFFRYLPAVFVASLAGLDWFSAALTKIHISLMLDKAGWPRLPRRQENPIFARELALRRRISDEVAALSEQEALSQGGLRDFEYTQQAEATQLELAALARLGPKLDAVLRVRQELSLIFPRTVPAKRRRLTLEKRS